MTNVAVVKSANETAPEVLALSTQPLFSINIQRQMVQHSREALAEIFLSAVPYWIINDGKRLTPPLNIPNRAEIENAPSLLLPQMQRLIVHLKDNSASVEEKSKAKALNAALKALCTSLQFCQKSLENKGETSTANLGTLEQRARVFAFLSKDIKELFDKIPEPVPEQTEDTVKIEIIEPEAAPKSEERTTLKDLLAFLDKREPQIEKPQLAQEELPRPETNIQDRIEARQFKKSWKISSKVLCASVIAVAGISTFIFGTNIQISSMHIPALVGIVAGVWLLAKFSPDREHRFQQNEERKSEHESSPSITKKNDQIGAPPTTSRAKDASLPSSIGPEDTREFALKESHEGGKTHVVSQDIEAPEGACPSQGTFRQGSNSNLSTLMCIQDPLVIGSRAGELIPLHKWIMSLTEEEQRAAIATLYVRENFETPINNNDLAANEAQLQFLLSGSRAILPLPANFSITQLELLDHKGNVLDNIYPLSTTRCRLGSAIINLPDGAKSVRYRIIPDIKNSPEIDFNLAKLLPSFELELPPTLSLCKETIEKLDVPPGERIALWFSRLAAENWLYSQCSFVANVLNSANENIAEALLGMQVGTCQTFALITAMSSQAFKVPIFVISGLVPTKNDDGNTTFMAKTGHSQVCTFINGQSYILDLTSSAQPIKIDIAHIPIVESNLLLLKLSSANRKETLVLADTARKIIEEAVLKTANDKSSLARKWIRNLLRSLRREQTSSLNEQLPIIPEGFKNQLPPIVSLDKKLAALQVIEYCCTFARLVRDRDPNTSAMPPINYLMRVDKPKAATAYVDYLPVELKHINSPQALTEFASSLAVEYIISILANPDSAAEHKAELVNFTIDQFDSVSEIQADFVTLSTKSICNDLTRRDQSKRNFFSPKQRAKLYQSISPYLDDIEFCQLSLVVFGRMTENLGAFGYKNGYDRFSSAPLSGSYCLPELIISFSNEIKLRPNAFNSEIDRQYLIHCLTFFISELNNNTATYEKWQELSEVERVNGLSYLFGAGEIGLERFNSALNIPKYNLSDTIYLLLKRYGSEALCSAFYDPVIKSQFAEMLGEVLLSKLETIQFSSHGLASWEPILEKIATNDIKPSLAKSRERLGNWIADKTKKLSAECNYFNAPEEDNPGSSLFCLLSKGETAYLWRTLKQTCQHVDGFSTKDVTVFWHGVNEAEVLVSLSKQLEPIVIDSDTINQKIVLLLKDSDETGSIIPISNSPELLERFFVEYRSPLEEGSGFIDPLTKALLDRQPKLNLQDPNLHLFSQIKNKFPQEWKLLNGESVESPLRNKYIALKCEALQIIFRRALNDLVSSQSNKVAALYTSMLAFQEWYIPIHRKLFDLYSADGLNIMLSHAREAKLKNRSRQYLSLSTQALELGVLTTLFLKFGKSWKEATAISGVLKESGFNDDLTNLFVTSQLPQSAKPSIKDFWNAAYTSFQSTENFEILSKQICEQLPNILKQNYWGKRMSTDPFQQFLITPNAAVISPSTAGDFDDFRPFSAGDDPALIHHISSARLGRPVIRKFIEEESRNLHLIIDVHSLISSYATLVRNKELSGGFLYLASILEFSRREGLSVDLSIFGRTQLLHYEDLQRALKGSKTPQLANPEFWNEILSYVGAAANFNTKEKVLFHQRHSFGYNPFAHEIPAIKAGQFNLFSIHPNNVSGAKKFAGALSSRGELVAMQTID